MNIAVILAGGTGTRVGYNVPKQFINILGKPVLAYTIERFQNNVNIDAIEIVCIASYIEFLKKLVQDNNYNKVKWVVEGGKDFQHSVMNGIYSLVGTDLYDDDIVLVHYGASPFISDKIIDDAIKVCGKYGNSVSATPCYLLYGSNDDGKKSSKWIDRDKIMQLNTPQCFKLWYVKQLYDEAIEKDYIKSVEPHTTSLMYKMGRTIYFSYGDQTNIKITTKEDLVLFKGWILANRCVD